MAREEFILSVRRAAKQFAPAVVYVGPRPDYEDYLRQVLQRSALWLSPKYVEAYAPEDFRDVSAETQNELREAVDSFREIAQRVGPTDAVSAELLPVALDRFERLVLIVKRIVLDDWRDAIESLIGQAEVWADELGWSNARRSKSLEESFLGSYELSQLHLSIDGVHLVLEPEGRFFPGTLGMAELAVVPTYESVRILRDSDAWEVRIDVGKTINEVRRMPWSRETLEDAVAWLRNQA